RQRADRADPGDLGHHPRPRAPQAGPPMNRSLSPGKKRPWILPLNHPPLVSAREASHMLPEDLVVGVVVDGRARAYPWFMAANYHVINDSMVSAEEPAGELLPKELGLTGAEAYPWYAHTPLL